MSWHQCPAPGCMESVRGDRLMCRTHWAMVTPALQRQLYAAWDNGAGAGTPAHREAIVAAIASVRGRYHKAGR